MGSGRATLGTAVWSVKARGADTAAAPVRTDRRVRAPMRSLLWFALVCHVAFATAFAFTTPSFEAPDENSHYEYAQHLANAGTLPLAPGLAQQRGLPQTEGAARAHEAPLYYSLLAAAQRLTGTDDTVFGPVINPAFGNPQQPSQHLHNLHGSGQGEGPLRLLRCLSVLLGAITIVLVHRLGRACCPTQPRVADLAALLAACLPMSAFLHGVLNNDVLGITLATATVLHLVRMLQQERVRDADGIRLGILLGLGLITKLTTAFLGGLAFVVFVTMWRRQHDRRSLARAAMLAAGITLMTSSWWFLRNLHLYGDPLAVSVHDAAILVIPPEYRWDYLLGGFLPQVFPSLLGRFGWFTLPPPAALSWGALGVAGIALLGLLRTASERQRSHAVRGWGLLLLTLLLVFAVATVFNWKAPQPQGRLLLPAIGPAAVLLAAGLLRATTRLPGRRWLALVLPLTTLAVFVFWFRPAFDPSLAPAPADHRALVGGIVGEVANPAITWQQPMPATPASAPPTLHWADPGAPADARYTLYAYDTHGRVWLASHEWTQGALVLSGDQAPMPEVAWQMLPRGIDLFLKLRRVPKTADEVPTALPTSAPLPFRRS